MYDHKNIFENAGRVAIVRTDRLGDMILTLPLCRAVREAFPDKKIIMIANSYTMPLLRDCPAIDDAVFIDQKKGGLNEIIASSAPEVIFFPRPRLEEAFGAYISRVPLRIGSAYRWYSILFNHRVHDHRKVAAFHEAEYNVRLLESITGQQHKTFLVPPVIQPASKIKIDAFLQENQIGESDRIVIIHPGSGGSARDWKAVNFKLLAKDLANYDGIKIIITGSKSEQEICLEVSKSNKKIINTAGLFSLEEIIALIAGASLFISNSTGVIHIAAALGVRVIGFYPSTPHLSAKRWGPYTKNAVILSPPQNNDPKIADNMDLVTVDEALDAVRLSLDL